YGRLITFQNYGCRTTAGNQPCTPLVERTRSLLWMIDIGCKYAQSIETGHGIRINFLGPSADDKILKTLLNKHKAHADSMRSTGAGSTDCHIHAGKAKYRSEVHRDGRIHRFEYRARTDQLGVPFIAHIIGRLDNGFRDAVVSIEDTYLALEYVFFPKFCLLKLFHGGYIRIFRLFTHTYALATAKYCL